MRTFCFLSSHFRFCHNHRYYSRTMVSSLNGYMLESQKYGKIAKWDKMEAWKIRQTWLQMGIIRRRGVEQDGHWMWQQRTMLVANWALIEHANISRNWCKTMRRYDWYGNMIMDNGVSLKALYFWGGTCSKMSLKCCSIHLREGVFSWSLAVVSPLNPPSFAGLADCPSFN